MSRKISCYGWLTDLPDHRDYHYAAPVAMPGVQPLSIILCSQWPYAIAKLKTKPPKSCYTDTLKSLPKSGEASSGDHDLMCVRYDNAKQWFMIRNSWGPKWGIIGYFTLPYPYLISANLTSDFWTIRLIQ
jgi:hypothetical protein